MEERSPLLPAEHKMEAHKMPISSIPSFTRAIRLPNGSSSTRTTQLPQAIAHRGYKAAHPENTMGAFKGAVKVGAHAVETDLHITKDGILVLSHDPTLKRCFGREEKIIDCDWAFLKTLETLKEPRENMPRLKDLLEYLATPGLEDIWVLLDIKLDNDASDMMRLIASTIKEVPPSSRPWNQRIVLGCWAAKYIPLCEAFLPDYPITHIGFSISYARKFLTPNLPHVSFNILQKILVGPFGASFIRDVKKANRVIFAWTVNETSWMRWSIRKELDGVISDDPKLFLEVCKRYLEEEEELLGKGKDGRGVKRKGDGVSMREYMIVAGINVLVTIFSLLFLWRFPFGDVGKAGGGKLRKGRMAL